MKKMLAIFLAVIMIISSVPAAFATEEDLYEKHDELLSLYVAYSSSVYYSTFDFAEMLDAEVIFGSKDLGYSDYFDSPKEYVEENPDALEPIIGLLEETVALAEEVFEDGYCTIEQDGSSARIPVTVVLDIVDFVSEARKQLKRIGMQDTYDIGKTLVYAASEQLDSEVAEVSDIVETVYEEAYEMTEAPSESEIKAYQERFDIAAEALLKTLNGIADCKEGVHTSEVCIYCGAVTTAKEGQCGDNVYWTFDEVTGTLTVSGEGKMYDYRLAMDSPFYNSADIVNVVIDSGVTGISSYAFNSCKKLESVTIADSVTSIGSGAFSGCTSLTSVNIPDGITEIAPSLFSECSSLENITIPDSVTKIGSSAFKKCTSLKNTDIPDNVTAIGTGAFDNCWSITQVNIPAKVKTIGASAFSDCSALTDVTIAYGVESIASGAFSDCVKLESIVIPDSVTELGDYVFYWCTNLKSAKLPANITNLGSELFLYCTELEEVNIPDGVTEIKYAAFRGCQSLREISIPDGVKMIASDAFAGCEKLDKITIPDSVEFIESLSAFSGTGYYNDESNWDNGVLYIGKHLIEAKDEITSCKIRTGTRTIAGGAFGGCAITSIDIPSSVISLGEGAFNACDNLTGVAIPEGVKILGDAIFYRCDNLSSITIADSVESIGEGIVLDTAFFADESNWDNGVLYIGKHLIRAKTDIESCEIRKDTKTIAGSAFLSCTKIKEIVIPEGIKKIEYGTFAYCQSLEDVYFPESLNYIETYAFMSATVKRMHIPSIESWCSIDLRDVSFLNYGGQPYLDGEPLREVTVPDGITKISAGAFGFCTELGNITIPKSVTSIGDYAFCYCTSLTDVYYQGSKSDWNKIKTGDENDYLMNATIHFAEGSEDDIEESTTAPSETTTEAEITTAQSTTAPVETTTAKAEENTTKPTTVKPTTTKPETPVTVPSTAKAPATKPVSTTKISETTQSEDPVVKAQKPAKVKAKKPKSTKKKQAVVTWAKVKNANGYQIAYSTSKKFKKKLTKTKLIKKAKTTKTTLKKLKSGKKYFIRVRAYKTVNRKKVHGAYSKVMTVKVR